MTATLGLSLCLSRSSPCPLKAVMAEAHSHAAMQTLKSGVLMVSDEDGYHFRLDFNGLWAVQSVVD